MCEGDTNFKVKPCPVGTYSEAGKKACSPCEAGGACVLAD
jgi:hypothetical protein